MRIALIGNRDLENGEHKDDVIKYHQVCYQLATMGITMTSGLAAKGSDAIAQRAYGKAIAEGKASTDQLEVYVSQQKLIDKSVLPYKEYSKIMSYDSVITQKRRDILKSVLDYNHYNNLMALKNNYALGMHERNVHQILGEDLQSPVNAVITWTVNGALVGGTATALKIAMTAGIPIFNLGRPDQDNVIKEIHQFLLNNNITIDLK